MLWIRLTAITVVLLVVLGALSPAPARAHPADEANVYHYLWFEPRSGTLELQHATVVGGLLTQAVWPEIDTDGNGAVSPEEGSRHARNLAAQVSLRVNGKPVRWTVAEQVYPSKEEFFGRSMAAITLRLRAPLPKSGGLVSVRDETFIHFTGVFPQPVIQPAGWSAGAPLVQEEGRLTEFRLTPGGASSPSASRPRLEIPSPTAAPDSLNAPDLANAPIFPEKGKVVYASPGRDAGGEGHNETAELKGFLNRPLSPVLILVALGAALVAGMAHALTPGHGKSMVAAYLVGTRGTVKDAILLGIVVTITHTAGVYLLGFLCLWLTRQIRAEVVGHWLSLTSGILVLGMGFWLFQRGLLAYYGLKPLPGHAHGPGGHTHGEAAPAHSHEHSQGHEHAHAQIRVHSHSHAHAPGHAHSHDAAPAATAESAGRRPPSDAPLEGYREKDQPLEGAERKGLIWLGVAGGIVPCFDALAILIAAVNLGRIELGLGLIAAFSLGMALVLVLIGILFVKAKDLVQRFSGEARWIKALPAVSGAILALLGAWLTFQAMVQAGILKT